jgi:hypothetical protein
LVSKLVLKREKDYLAKGRFEKGSQEARDFMKSLREKKGMKLELDQLLRGLLINIIILLIIQL